MLPTKNNTIQEGDLGGDKIDMQLDAQALAHIMSILTDLYSDKIQAVIREYSTNAWDSHVAAGNERPIEIFTPTSLSPYFRVKDYGVGMSKQDIIDIYSKYGASTKRNTNDQTGMLGLGCKSGLTYTNQFTIKAVKDGVLMHVMVSRDSKNAGMMEVLGESVTNEPNGVEISIPVKSSDFAAFKFRINEFFQYWKNNVLVDGKRPGEKVRFEITDNIWMLEGQGNDVYVMGGVPYIHDKSHKYRGYHVVFFVEMGELDFVPSREKLHYTVHTSNTIGKYEKLFEQLKTDAFQKEINRAKSKSEALKTALKIQSIVGESDRPILYNGVEIPWSLPYEQQAHFYGNGKGSYGYNGRLYFRHHSAFGNQLILLDYDKPELTSHAKAKLKQYIRDNQLPSNVYLVSDFDLEWIEDLDFKIVSWTKVKHTKIVRTPKVKKKSSYYARRGNYFSDTTDIDDKKIMVYGTKADIEVVQYYLSDVFPEDKYEFIRIQENRVKKLLTEYPNIKHFRAIAEDILKKQLDAISQEDLLLYSTGHYDRVLVSQLDPTLIEDPALVTLIMESKKDPKHRNINKIDRLMSAAQSFGLSKPEAEDKVKLKTRYPLIGTLGYSATDRDIQHNTIYINAVYNALYKEKK